MFDVSNRKPLAASIASLALLIAFAWRGFLTGPHSPFTGDIQHYHHAVTRALVRAFGDGRFPLWTDHTYFGFPFFADPQTAIGYPGTLLVAQFGPHWGYVLFLVLHSLLAALGTLALVRSHGVAWSAAGAAGLLLALSGYFASEAQHPGLFAILCWLPTWLWTTRRVFRRATPGRVAAAALTVAMMLLAGTLQVLFGALILYGFYLFGLLLDAPRAHGWKPALRSLSITIAAQGLGLSLAAVALLPAVAHLQMTARALGMSYEFAAMGSVHPVELLGVFVNSAASLLGQGLELDYAGASFYQSSLALPLALVGLFATKGATRIATALAVAILAALALGREGWLHPQLYAWFPSAVGGLRGMGRALGPAALGLALLAGLGLQRLGEPGKRARVLLAAFMAAVLALYAAVFGRTAEPIASRTWGSAVIVLLAFVLTILPLLLEPLLGTGARTSTATPARWLVALRSGGLLRGCLVGLLAFDLVAFGALDEVLRANPPPPQAQHSGGIAVGEVPDFVPDIAPDIISGDIPDDIPDDIVPDMLPDMVPQLDEIARGAFGHPGARVMLHGFGPLNLPLLQGVDGVGGYNPLVMLQYLDFVSLINNQRLYPRVPLDRFVSGAKPQRFNSKLFDAASVRFVISNRPEAARDLRLVKHYTDSYFAAVGASLYENEDALPRAYLAYRTQRAWGAEELARLVRRDFDGRRVSIVEGDAPKLRGRSTITAVARLGTVPEARLFEFSTDQPAVLVVTDTFYPGWRAWVDDVEAPVFRVNGMFRGVAVPAGARRVEMRFEPMSFRVGAAISGVAACVIFALVSLAVTRSRRKPSHES